jgi:hypothetical protein
VLISWHVGEKIGTAGPHARRMLQAVGDGATDPAAVAALADQWLRATPD